MKLLLDADMLLFKTMSALQVEVCLNDYDEWTYHLNHGVAFDEYWQSCHWLAERFDVPLTDVVHCFTDRSTFRKNVSPDYKGNRKGMRKPLGYKAMKDRVLDNESAWMHDMVEADDLLGIFSGMCAAEGEEYIVCSGDKDLLQIPGRHYWFDPFWSDAKGKVDLHAWLQKYGIKRSNTYEFIVSETAAMAYFWAQVLAGDSTDGVPGCPGYGPVKAQRCVDGLDLQDPLGCWEAIVQCFEKAGSSRGHALTQLRLVRVLRATDYSFTDRTVKLWNPPTPTNESSDSK